MVDRLDGDPLARLRRLVDPTAPVTGTVVEDRYEIRQLLGRGGMAEVYHAWDRRIDRPVAIKVMATGLANPELMLRFESEARVMARIDHPGIVPVHDSGRLPDGRLYFVMKYVPGSTLESRIRPQDRSALLEQLVEICAIVSHAHAHGVVHRDLKPANVMIDESGRVFVLDWGLSRSFGPIAEGAPDIGRTDPGSIMGTMGYMAPEQARGERGDKRSDIFALGAILYRMLTGRTALAAATAANALQAARAGSYPSPRAVDPSIPVELELICLKAMKPDPTRRYDSVAAMGNDLSAFLAGLPIEAHPPSMLYRFRKFADRHRTAILAGIAGIVVLGALIYHARKKDRERRDAIRELVIHLRTNAAVLLDAALELRRAGKVREMEALLPKMEDLCRTTSAKAPELAEPHCILGKMYRACMRFDEAMREQDRALALDPALVEARYERGILRLEEYQKRVESLREEWWRRHRGPLPPDRMEDDFARGLRNGAKEDLRRVEKPDAEALRAWLEEDFEKARQLFRRVVAESPALEIGYEWLGYLSWNDPDEAAKWFTEGLGQDAGYFPFLAKRAQLYFIAGVRERMEGGDPLAPFDRAATDYRRLVELFPSRVPSLLDLGHVHIERGNYVLLIRQDPSMDFEAALRLFERAREIAPEDDQVWMSLGMAHVGRGREARRGGDPLPHFARAEECLDRAIRLCPERGENWLRRGQLHFNRGLVAFFGKGDPIADFSKAVDDLNEACRLDVGDVEALEVRGTVRIYWGGREADPAARCQDGIRDLDEVLRLEPRSLQALSMRGDGRLLVGSHWATSRPKEAEDLLNGAIQDLERSVRLDSSDAETWRRLGMSHLNLAWILDRQAERDPSPDWRKAEAAFGKAIALLPTHAELWFRRGEVRLKLLRRDLADAQLYRDLQTDFQEAVRLEPDRADAYRRRGEAHFLKEQWRSALADFEKAVALRVDLVPKLRGKIDICRRRLGGS